jgi:hypothetical protein
LLLAMATAAVAVYGSVAQASVNGSSISIAFARDEPPGTNGCALNPADVAGAGNYATANWVNETTNMGSDTNLKRDDNGVASATTASVTWACDNTWSTDGVRAQFNNAFTGPDQALMNGYMDCGNNAVQGFTSVDITGLPSDFAAGFSVVVYTLGGGSTNNRQEFIYVNDPTQANPLYVWPGGPGGATTYYAPTSNGQALVRTYVQAIGDDPAYGPDSYGNYVVVTKDGSGKPLSGTSVSIQVVPNTFRGALNGVQIIKNP